MICEGGDKMENEVPFEMSRAQADADFGALFPSHGKAEAEPNCPLKTGLRPCMCDLPRCPVCNYTKHDAAFEMDHDRCRGVIPK